MELMLPARGRMCYRLSVANSFQTRNELGLLDFLDSLRFRVILDTSSQGAHG